MKVILKKIERIFDDFFKIDRAIIQHEKFDGAMTPDLIRFNFERGHSVAVLLVNASSKTVVLTHQFRFPAYLADPEAAWLLEIPAGMLPANTDPVQMAIKEVEEEVGYQISDVELLYHFYASVGGSTERLYLYYAEVDDSQKIAAGGGLSNEGEDIQIINMPISDAIAALDSGQIIDSKTIIAFQWLKLNASKFNL
ncbi:NUDIX domain-containing protein [candidate division KSB1 bacterium]|nr:NUDIX domain-containing protein [candidate division KSB1 bacterium]